ncbi:MAG: PqqD family peptide modification chaperone [Nitrososphaerales archaeon]
MAQQRVTEDMVITALKQCMDPEVPLSVVELGLIYGVNINDKNDVNIRMTMTTPGCPLHDTLVNDVKRYLGKVQGVGNISVEIVWDPPWNPDRMSPEAKEKIYGKKSLRFSIDLDKSKLLKQGNVVQQQDGSVALLNDQRQGFMVNEALIEFWKLCDGTKTLNYLIDAFSTKLNMPRADIEKEVVELVQQMLEAGLLKTES